jgi:hypothetical protein
MYMARRVIIACILFILMSPKTTAEDLFPNHEYPYYDYDFGVSDYNYTINFTNVYEFPFNPIFENEGVYFTDRNTGECSPETYQKLIAGEYLVYGIGICSIDDHSIVLPRQSGSTFFTPVMYSDDVILFGNSSDWPFGNQIIGFNLSSKTIQFELDLPDTAEPVKLVFSPDRNFVGIAAESCILVVDMISKNTVLWETAMDGWCNGISSRAIAFTPDGSTFISHDKNNDLAGWSTETWTKIGNSSGNFGIHSDFLIEDIIITSDNLTAFFFAKCVNPSQAWCEGTLGTEPYPHSLYKASLNGSDGIWDSVPVPHFFGEGTLVTNYNNQYFGDITNRQESGACRSTSSKPPTTNQNRYIHNEIHYDDSMGVIMIDMRKASGVKDTDCYHGVQFKNTKFYVTESYVFLNEQGELLQSLDVKCHEDNAGWIPRIVDGQIWIKPCGIGHEGFFIELTLTDYDNDGYPNINDMFPFDSLEWYDSDLDGCGDNSDIFPNNHAECSDTDGDGVGDTTDKFVNDYSEWNDSDGDGVGDNSDVFPSNPAEWSDLDRDGVGDNADVFPRDANESSDSDGDGVGDNSDEFPFDSSKSSASDIEDSSNPLFLILFSSIIISTTFLLLRRKSQT